MIPLRERVRDAQFIGINYAPLPESLIEAELFGADGISLSTLKRKLNEYHLE